jgi:hypothetical protein
MSYAPQECVGVIGGDNISTEAYYSSFLEK